jgi:hypothetical protein
MGYSRVKVCKKMSLYTLYTVLIKVFLRICIAERKINNHSVYFLLIASPHLYGDIV